MAAKDPPPFQLFCGASLFATKKLPLRWAIEPGVMSKKMSPVPGNESCESLMCRLVQEFGPDDLEFLYEFGPEIDAIAWKLRSLVGFDFSASTVAGTLPPETFNFESGVCLKGSLEHGTPVFVGDVNVDELIQIVRDHIAGKYS